MTYLSFKLSRIKNCQLLALLQHECSFKKITPHH
jgi:hypothetical protein